MSIANTKASTGYQAAISATKSLWEDSSAGLVDKTEGANLSNITKQLNTAVFLLIRLDNKLADLTERVERLSTRVGNLEKAKGADITSSIEDLSNKLANIKISDTRVREVGGNLKVYKNPYTILQEVRRR